MIPPPPPPPSNKNKTKIIVIVSVVIAVLLIALFAAWLTFNGGNGGGNLFALGPTPAPTPIPDFSVRTDDSSGITMQGGTVKTTVYVDWVGGSSQPVTLTADSGSSGIHCGFSPSSGTPSYSSTLVMDVPSSTSTNPYSITITATNGAVTRSTSYTVTVLSAQVYVSGTVTTTGLGTHPSSIQFVDQSSGVTYTGSLSDKYYSITLQNQHTYTVTVGWEGLLYSTGTYSGGSLYVTAPVGYTSMTQDYSG